MSPPTTGRDLPASLLDWSVNDPLKQLRSADERLEPNRKIDPATVVNTSQGVDAQVQAIVNNHQGAPRAAQLVTKRLLEVYGPFTASNTAANRQAIIDNLLWIAGKGVRYDTPRANSGKRGTQSPNQTLSQATGICRDTHTAMAAILSSLMHAEQQNGKWVPGEPSNEGVCAIGFSNPKERHAYLVYMDPVTNKWNALEYGRHYALQSASAVDAFTLLPHYVPTFHRYMLTGWDGGPSIGDRGWADSRARDFFAADPGEGQAGELRMFGNSTRAGATFFATPQLSLTAAFDPSKVSEGFAGGVKLDFHKDFSGDYANGYVRVAGGVYHDELSLSDTSKRAESSRTGIGQTVFALKVDARVQGQAPIFGPHLALSYGAGADLYGALPINSHNDDLNIGKDIQNMANAQVFADVGLGGKEALGGGCAVEWGLRYQHAIDFMHLARNVNASGGEQLGNAFGANAGNVSGAAAFSYDNKDGSRLRIEAGLTRDVNGVYDAPFATGTNYAGVGVSSEDEAVQASVIVNGASSSTGYRPISGGGASLAIKPIKEVTIGGAVTVQAPNGSLSRHQGGGADGVVNLNLAF